MKFKFFGLEKLFRPKKQYHTKRYKYLKKMGLCTQCQSPNLKTIVRNGKASLTSRCVDCLVIANENRKRRECFNHKKCASCKTIVTESHLWKGKKTIHSRCKTCRIKHVKAQQKLIKNNGNNN